MTRWHIAWVAFLWLPVGCAENAFLELMVDLPAACPGETTFGLIQARRADVFPFENTDWRADQDPEALQLGTEPIRDHISLESKDETIDVNVRIRYCGNSRCTDLNDGAAPEVWVTIERPFFIGERTFWEFAAQGPPCDGSDPGTPPLGGEALVVDRCQIRGCVDGDMSTDYCRMDGTHVCEPPLR